MKYLFLVTLFLASTISRAQSNELLQAFESDLQKALEHDFDKPNLEYISTEYNELLWAHTSFSNPTQEDIFKRYPLSQFKETALYIKVMDQLLENSNLEKRMLAYSLISSSGDMSYEKYLCKLTYKEKNKPILVAACMTLLALETKNVEVLFDCLIKHGKIGQGFILATLPYMDSTVLEQLVYDRINDKNNDAKVLAVHLLSKIAKTERSEQLLLSCIRNWDDDIKGYAIQSAYQLKLGNLLGTFQSLLSDSKIRPVALKALANSPTKEDTDFVKKLVDETALADKDLLNAFYLSDKIDNIRYWLALLATEKIPNDYRFSTTRHKFLHKDTLLPDVQNALKKCTTIETKRQLIRVVGNRTDSITTQLLLTILDSKDSKLRYSAARSLKKRYSPKLLDKMLSLIQDRDGVGHCITGWFIEHKIDSLQELYQDIYNNTDNPNTKWYSLEYLAHFPKPQHRFLFQEILENCDDKKFTYLQLAAKGSGLLKDKSVVKLLMKRCKANEKTSMRHNYLRALVQIKDPSSKDFLRGYLDDRHPRIKEMIATALDNW